MLFDISELDPRGVGLDYTVEIPPFLWEGGDTIECEPASLVGRLTPTRRGIELTGRWRARVHQHCSRCLAPFARPVEERFRLFLVPPPPEEGEPLYEGIPEDDSDAVDLYPLEGQVVDFAQVLREQVDLALPYRALCREDCRGLCAGCGADLNESACHCQPTADERFSQLEGLRRVLEERKGRDPSAGR